MGSPSKLFAATLCCFTFTVMHIYGELVMLHHSDEPNTSLQSYTCIADDDGSALVWSYDGKMYFEEDFRPKRPASGNVHDCGIRGQSSCLAEWDKTSDWHVVNSVAKPTGPVFDQRWDDFQINQLPPSRMQWQYQKLGSANEPSGTVWFSGTHLSNGGFGVLLCEREEPQLGPCVRIQVSSGDTIHVQYCTSEAITPDGYLQDSECDVDREIRDGTFVNSEFAEWHTFRLEWNTRQKTIKMFQTYNSEPFVEGPMPPWDRVSAVAATVLQNSISHVKYHIFDYYFTDTKNAVISTKGIEHSGKMFCAELLLGLCPRCKLNVTLTDEYGSDIETWPFSGDEQDPYNGLLAWRLVKLTTRFDSDIWRRLTLKIETILDGDKGAGEWAIDNFRICQTGKLRESKIWMGDRFYDFHCRRLSYNGSSVIHRFSTEDSADAYQVLSELQEFIRYQNYSTLIGSKGRICSTNGCICGRGFTPYTWCEEECDDGFYWYSCTKKCGSCRDSEPCVKTTGFCESGCHRDNMIEPFCKMALNALTIENIRGTSATLLQSVEFVDKDEVPNKLEFQIREAEGESWTNFPTKLKDSELSSRYEAHITGLKPSTAYEVRAAVFVGTELAPTVTFGPMYNLTTTCSEKSILMVIPSERSSTIEFDQEGVIHSILGHPFSVLVTNTLTDIVASSAFGMCLPFYVTGLTPSTDYKVKIVDMITRCTLLNTRFRTSESAPTRIRNLGVKSISDIDITLQWDPPEQENGVVMRSYGVSLKLTELKGCTDLNKLTPPEEEIVRIVNETTVFFDGLHPYAKYVVSVAVQTPKPGPPVSLFFETNFAAIPTSMVSNLRVTEDKSCVLWDKPADCTTITGPTEVTRLFFTRVSDSALIRKDQTADSYFNLSDLNLDTLPWHKVRVHVLRGYDQPENPDVYQELTWGTNFDAPTVVDVTYHTARIVQNVASSGYDGKVFVTFILRDVLSNESFARFPTHTTADDHELYANNLKPKTLYKVHTLVTILKSDRAATLDGSPILFKTKCRDGPYFEVSPGEHDLTIRMSSSPEDCFPPANKLYSINVYDTAAKDSSKLSISYVKFPVLLVDMNPDTEYKVEVWIWSQRESHLVYTTYVRTSASKESVPKANWTRMFDHIIGWSQD